MCTKRHHTRGYITRMHILHALHLTITNREVGIASLEEGSFTWIYFESRKVLNEIWIAAVAHYAETTCLRLNIMWMDAHSSKGKYRIR